MRIALVGVGNTLAADDGIGIRVLREFRSRIDDERIACLECDCGGFDLLDKLAGFDSAIITDAARTGVHASGAVFEFTLRRPFGAGTPLFLHTLGFGGVLAFGEAAGLELPEEVTVYGIEAADIETFGAGCTPLVEAAIPNVVARLSSRISLLVPDVRFSSASHTEAVA